jgi:hypothetical protein
MNRVYIKDNIEIDIKRIFFRKNPKCPNCGREILIRYSETCKYCGWSFIAKYPSRFTKKLKRNIFSWTLKILGLLLILLASYFKEGILKSTNSILLFFIIVVIGLIILICGTIVDNREYWFSFSKNEFRRLLKILPNVLFVSVMYSVVTSVLLIHFLRSLVNKNGIDFDLAIFSATIGSLVMVGGFVDRSDKYQASKLINIGKYFLSAAALFAILKLCGDSLLGFQEPYNLGYWILYSVTILSLLFSAMSFAIALSLLLPTIFKIGNERIRNRG